MAAADSSGSGLCRYRRWHLKSVVFRVESTFKCNMGRKYYYFHTNVMFFVPSSLFHNRLFKCQSAEIPWF